MAKRIENQDMQALLNIRRNLIQDHERLLDGAMAPHSAMCKQSDVAVALTRAIKGLEEVLTTAGDVSFK